ncbi:cell wall-binding repeat-containing protein [Streptomyces sp. PSKA54]|uniref:Cell wall-binding repeat-containing protein n=1 Tax=Streptomyces himalayensis subsp. aureolus TaxID=2758039 RepID=A0A7W2CY64_9ACTN|nr:cell wall-binding repeat-containing protein [Streptomyces himalayensis]MBA4861055.1 cell wall-binding repeat-containing protein [Streptomyces himalayensis subsp. aureolus]
MKIRRCRVLAALGTAVAVAAGMAAAPGAAAAEPVTWQASDGKLMFVNGARNVLQTHQLGTSTYTDFVAGGWQPAWSPDGSRVAYVKDGRVETRRYTGSTLVKIPERDTPRGVGHPTFLYTGNTIVYSEGGRLRYAPSDGSRYAEPLFSTAEDGCDRQPSASVNGLIAFVRTGDTCGSPTGSAIWLYDDTTGGFTKLTDNGDNPAISPDGTQVAFVREADGLSRLFVINVDGTGERQLTFTDAAYTPAWSPSGTRIAVNNGTDEDASTTRIVDVTTGGVTPVPQPPGTSSTIGVAWQPLRSQSVGRVWGADSSATNVAASRWTWNTVGQSEPGLIDARTAVLISKDSPSYALTGQTLAGQKQGPLLMTSKTSLSTTVQTELKRALKPGATVYLVGGTDILSSTVASKVSSLGFTPKRLAGTSRYSTSVAVARAVTSAPEYVFLATGTDYHSALAASAAAGAIGYGGKGTVVLNDGNKLTSSVKSYLNSLDPDQTRVIPVGSSAKYALTHTYLSNWPDTWTYYPISGSGHDGTSVALARFWWSSPYQVGLAWSDSWRGGVSASTGMLYYGPVLWTDETTLTETDATYLRQQAAGVNSVIAFGGTGSISAAELSAAGSAISAGSSLVDYHPYYNGLVPAQQSALSAPRAASDIGTAAPRAGTSAPQPDLDGVRTTNR